MTKNSINGAVSVEVDRLLTFPHRIRTILTLCVFGLPLPSYAYIRLGIVDGIGSGATPPHSIHLAFDTAFK